jgi:hypothetical protein
MPTIAPGSSNVIKQKCFTAQGFAGIQGLRGILFLSLDMVIVLAHTNLRAISRVSVAHTHVDRTRAKVATSTGKTKPVERNSLQSASCHVAVHTKVLRS